MAALAAVGATSLYLTLLSRASRRPDRHGPVFVPVYLRMIPTMVTGPTTRMLKPFRWFTTSPLNNRCGDLLIQGCSIHDNNCYPSGLAHKAGSGGCFRHSQAGGTAGSIFSSAVRRASSLVKTKNAPLHLHWWAGRSSAFSGRFVEFHGDRRCSHFIELRVHVNDRGLNIRMP